MEKYCSWGNGISTSFLGDSCILRYTVVMYHLITNNTMIYLYVTLIILSILRIFLVSHGVFGYIFDLNNPHIKDTMYCEHILTHEKCS